MREMTINPQVSVYRCSAVCQQMPDCSIFTYDTTTNDCHVAPGLTEIIILVASPASRITYFSWIVDGYIYNVTETTGTWTDGKVACEMMGGKMTVLPTTSFGVVIHYLYDLVYLGISRPVGSTDKNTWYDVDGNVITQYTKWGLNQPNNYGGAQYIVRIYQGFLDDNSDTTPLRSLCAMRL